MISLADLCTCVDYGYTASASADPAIGPKFLRITDIVPDLIDWGTVPYCEIEEDKREKFLLDEGDIVVARTGATVGYAKQIWARPEGATFASYLVRFRPDPAKVDSYYLGEIVQSTLFKRWVKSVAGGAAQPNANAKLLGSFEVPALTPDQQRKVGRTLRAVGELIENSQARIRVLEDMVRQLYDQWLVRFRFPSQEEPRLVDSDIGPIPTDWTAGRFGDLVEVSRDAVDPEDIEPGAPLVGLEHLPRRSTTLLEWDASTEVGSRKSLFVDGDILFGKIRPYFHKVAHAPVSGYCSTDAIVFHPHLEVRGMALAVASSDAFVGYAVQTSNGTKMPRANTEVLLDYPAARPPADLLEQFEEAVNPMISLCKSLSAEMRILRRARDFLLPRLVSGELELPELDLDLDPVA